MYRTRLKYKVNGVVGHIERRKVSTGVYSIRDTHGNVHSIDQDVAAGIVAAESARTAAHGRPPLFGGVEVESRTITLPSEYWERIPGNYSLYIAGLIEKTISGGSI